MTLDVFVKAFVCHNTMIRLWVEDDGGHKMLVGDNGEEIGMEWQLIRGIGWQSKYAYHLVIGVTDILCDTYPEAVNIVILETPVSYM